MGREFGLPSDGGEVGINCLTTLLAYHLHDGGEELHAVGSTIPLVGIGKMVTDVPLFDGPKERVHQNVQCYISVGVTEQS